MSYLPITNSLGTSTGLDNLRKWRTALADLDNGTITKYNLVYVGDSIGEGTGGNVSGVATRDLGHVGRFRTALANRYDDVGTGMIAAHYPTDFPLWTYSSTGSTSDWTVSGSFGISGRAKTTQIANATATMTFDGIGVTVGVVRGGITGNLEVKIDGVVMATIDTNGSLNTAARYDFTGLTPGPHTLALRNLGFSTAGGTGANYMFVIGAQPIKGNRGVILHNSSGSGNVAVDYTNADRLNASVDQFAPVLTIVSLMANDFTLQTALATYVANLQTIVAHCAAFGDVLLISTGARNIAPQPIPEPMYNAAMRSVAITNAASGVGFLDLYSRWRDGPYAMTTLGLIADGVHPTLKGHIDLSNALSQVLLEPTTIIPRNVKTLRSVNATATVVASDSVIRVDATAGAFTLTLPSATDQSGRQFVIKKIDASSNAVTVAAAAGQFIDGGATAVLSGQYIALTVVSDGFNWMVI